MNREQRLAVKNLTKENFFDELQEKCSQGMKVFCDWIDEYKKENNWDKIFGTERHKYIKYHDLPLAFQIGIYIEFAQDRGGCSYEVDLFEFDLRTDFTNMIEMLQEEEQS